MASKPQHGSPQVWSVPLADWGFSHLLYCLPHYTGNLAGLFQPSGKVLRLEMGGNLWVLGVIGIALETRILSATVKIGRHGTTLEAALRKEAKLSSSSNECIVIRNTVSHIVPEGIPVFSSLMMNRFCHSSRTQWDPCLWSEILPPTLFSQHKILQKPQHAQSSWSTVIYGRGSRPGVAQAQKSTTGISVLQTIYPQARAYADG